MSENHDEESKEDKRITFIKNGSKKDRFSGRDDSEEKESVETTTVEE